MLARTWFTILSCCVAIILMQGRALADEHEFRYKAPDAKSVELMCEFNGWKSVPMTKGDDGVWTVKVTLSPGTYGYKFLVDGKDWVFDPDNSAKKTVDGIENSAVEIK
jgi:1,4-alpha-glucan branching enzyme